MIWIDLDWFGGTRISGNLHMADLWQSKGVPWMPNLVYKPHCKHHRHFIDHSYFQLFEPAIVCGPPHCSFVISTFCTIFTIIINIWDSRRSPCIAPFAFCSSCRCKPGPGRKRATVSYQVPANDTMHWQSNELREQTQIQRFAHCWLITNIVARKIARNCEKFLFTLLIPTASKLVAVDIHL